MKTEAPGAQMPERAATPHETTTQPPLEPRQGRGVMLIALMLLAAGALGFFIYRGINTRVSAETTLVTESRASAALDVAVTHPKIVGGAQEIVLPGNIQAFTDAPIYARTSGYLKKWYADIGARVHAGQLLAEIDSPEVDSQLLQAKAELATAEANLKLAQIEADRWQGLIKTNAVSQDELDQKVGALNADKAILASDQANVKHLEDLVSFEKVAAPFDGVVTARKTDVGALINAGVGTGAPELFHIAAVSRLRVFVNMPEQDVRAAREGATAQLVFTEFPGRTFTGTITRNSNAIDPSARTLLVEVDVDNPKGELLPGAYVSVHFKLPGSATALTVPANALLFRTEGLRVALVRDNKAQLVPIHVGRDFGDSLEVTDGLKADDTIVINPPDSLVSGEPVRFTAPAK